MITIDEHDSRSILQEWAFNLERKATVLTYDDFNPLNLVSEVLRFGKSKTNKILIVVASEYHKAIYDIYFKGFPALYCKVILYEDKSKVESYINNLDLLILDTIPSESISTFINTVNPERYLILTADSKYKVDITLEYEPHTMYYLNTYNLNAIDVNRYITYHEFVVDKYRLFKSLARHFSDNTNSIPNTPYDIVRYCMYGIYIGDVKMSYNKVCLAIAKEEGWHRDLIADTPSNKEILETFTPDNLHEIAKRFIQYSKSKSDIINLNKSLLDIIDKLSKDLSDTSDVELIIHDSLKVGEFITNVINSDYNDKYQKVMTVGNTLTSKAIFDYNTNDYFRDKYGKVKILGTKTQLRAVNEFCENGHVNLLNTGKTIKSVNVPKCVNRISMCTVDDKLLTRFEKSIDAESLIIGQESGTGLANIKAYRWYLVDVMFDFEGNVVIPKPLSCLIKMASDPNCKRPYYEHGWVTATSK